MGVELLYNSVKTEVKTVRVPVPVVEGVIDECGRESHTRPKGLGALIELGSREVADKMQ